MIAPLPLYHHELPCIACTFYVATYLWTCIDIEQPRLRISWRRCPLCTAKARHCCNLGLSRAQRRSCTSLTSALQQPASGGGRRCCCRRRCTPNWTHSLPSASRTLLLSASGCRQAMLSCISCWQLRPPLRFMLTWCLGTGEPAFLRCCAWGVVCRGRIGIKHCKCMFAGIWMIIAACMVCRQERAACTLRLLRLGLAGMTWQKTRRLPRPWSSLTSLHGSSSASCR